MLKGSSFCCPQIDNGCSGWRSSPANCLLISMASRLGGRIITQSCLTLSMIFLRKNDWVEFFKLLFSNSCFKFSPFALFSQLFHVFLVESKCHQSWSIVGSITYQQRVRYHGFDNFIGSSIENRAHISNDPSRHQQVLL